MSITATATITDRGQVTLPKVIRETLGNIKALEFEVTDNVVTVHAIPDMSGCLSKYAKHPAEPLREIRKKVWSEVAHGKTS
jgi:bifunctional DNA-binding transcriptional regulator/antitoxin component of YhaV-PrlF toxin-antitoxin module